METAMQRVLAASLAALALSACSTAGHRAEFSEIQSNPRHFFNLNAPVLVADASIAGTTVALKEGHALIVRLPEDASVGVWRMRPLPSGSIIAPVQHDYTAVAGADPARAPVGGEATFRLRGVAPGTQAVTLDFLRPGFTAPEKSLAFDVQVK
jgi:predicted secreted protein